MKISEQVKSLSRTMAIKASDEAAYFPIDRNFLIPYLKEIVKLNPVEFVVYSLEQANPTYTNLLFLCLPEIWENIDVDDIETIVENLSNDFSYFTLIEFTYKYLEVDILKIILKQAKKKGVDGKIRQYLQNQWNVIIKSTEDRTALETGIGQEFFDYDNRKWNYIKQKLLFDKRLHPALFEYKELERYINTLTTSTN